MTGTRQPTDDRPRNALGETATKVAVRRLVIVVIVLACIGLLVLAAKATQRGDEKTTLTGAGDSSTVVELLTPSANETLVNQQSQVGIDLTTPYTASLVVNGITIPDDQLLKRPELSAVYFTPGPGKVIDKLPPGRNCVQALVSRVDGTPESINPITWCFGVA